MRSEFISDGVWRQITRAVRGHPDRCCIAVAYFGSIASELLPLKRGSILVVDMSEDAIKGGQTNPSEIIKLLRRGVSVHTVCNLHAKVCVAGRAAFIGSMNASSNSQKGLIEAAIRITDPATVASCRDFVKSLCGEPVTLEDATKLKRLYPRKRMRARGKPIPQHQRLWVLGLTCGSFDEEDKKAHKEAARTARRLLQSQRWFYDEQIRGIGVRAFSGLKKRDLVVCVDDEGYVSPPGRVLAVKRYKARRGQRAFLSLELRKGLRRRSVDSVVAQVGRGGGFLRRCDDVMRVRDLRIAHKLLNIWPNA